MKTTYELETLTLQVEFDYQPSERATLTYPGCASDVELNSVMLNETDLLPHLNHDTIVQIEEECISNVETLDCEPEDIDE